MAIDALRSYLQLASGLTDVTKERARAAAQAVVSNNPLEGGTSAVTALGSTVTANASALADDLVAASKANRKLLVGLIRSEVDRAVHRLGLATGDEVDALAERVARIEGDAGSKKTTARQTPAKKTAVKKTAARKTPGTKTAVENAVVEPAVSAGSSDAGSSDAGPPAAAPPAAAPPSAAEDVGQ